MVYTESRKIGGKKYFYRVLSVRKGDKVSKKRVYLGVGLEKSELAQKEKHADEKLLSGKSGKIGKEIGKMTAKTMSILKKNKVKRAGVFGSYARGRQKKNSDIDIAVEIADKNMSLLGFIRLIRLLETALKRKVDLVEYGAIKPRMRKRILEEEIRII